MDWSPNSTFITSLTLSIEGEKHALGTFIFIMSLFIVLFYQKEFDKYEFVLFFSKKKYSGNALEIMFWYIFITFYDHLRLRQVLVETDRVYPAWCNFKLVTSVGVP